MTPDGMLALRRAATLAHAFPGVRLRLRHEEQTLLEVGGGSECLMSACAFRRAVACAHEHLKRGARLSFMGLPHECAPKIEVGVPRGDVVHPHGLYRVRAGEHDVHAFVTTLPARQCAALRRQCTAPADTAHDVRYHRDAATEITFVHLASPATSEPTAPHPLLDELLLACAVEEIVVLTSGGQALT